MDELEMTTTELTDELTDEQRAEMEAAQAAEEKKRMGAYIHAAKQRQESAAIIAEHDNVLAEVLFELTMNSIGEV